MTSHDAQTVGVIDNQYFYDGDGRRVKKVVGSVSTIYVYDIQGEMVAEYTDYITTQSSGTSYLTADNLGTPRVITNNEGAVISRHDYLPFGEEISVGVDGRTASQGYIDDGVREKFTGKERDDETGLDYFDARYYSSSSGRFTSLDPIFISDKQTCNPQLWNLYSYVGNNPLAYSDPTGMELVRLGQHTDEEIDARRKAIDEEKKTIRQDANLTKAEQNEKRSKLEAEKRTLGLEKQGNQAARAFIERLESIGEGQGLQVSDFTLSTDPKNDFVSDATFVRNAGGLGAAKQLSENSASAFMFYFVGYKSDIYINTTSGNYQLLITGDADMVTYAGTAAVHERNHRDSPTRKQQLSEGGAYTEQLRVLQKFGPAAFKSSDFYENAVKFVTDGSKRKD